MTQPYGGTEKPFWVMLESQQYPGDLRFFSSHDTREEAQALADEKNQKAQEELHDKKLVDSSITMPWQYRYSVVDAPPAQNEKVNF